MGILSVSLTSRRTWQSSVLWLDAIAAGVAVAAIQCFLLDAIAYVWGGQLRSACWLMP